MVKLLYGSSFLLDKTQLNLNLIPLLLAEPVIMRTEFRNWISVGTVEDIVFTALFSSLESP